jgi:hypothetical protein
MQGLWKNTVPRYKKDSRRKKQKRKHFIKDKIGLYYKDTLSTEKHKKVFSEEKEIIEKYEMVKEEVKVSRKKLSRYTIKLPFNKSLCIGCPYKEDWNCYYCEKINRVLEQYKKEVVFDYTYYDRKEKCQVGYYTGKVYPGYKIEEEYETIVFFENEYKRRIRRNFSFYNYGQENKFFYGKREFLAVTRQYHSSSRRKYCRKKANRVSRRNVKLFLKTDMEGYPKDSEYSKSIAWCIW